MYWPPSPAAAWKLPAVLPASSRIVLTRISLVLMRHVNRGKVFHRLSRVEKHKEGRLDTAKMGSSSGGRRYWPHSAQGAGWKRL